MNVKISTNSALMAWYLKTRKGCRVFYRVRTPHFAMLGIVVYQTTWVLQAA